MVHGAAELTQVRTPDCETCPLSSKRKVWGQGPLDAKVLVVGESGEDDGHFTEWAWGRIRGLLSLGGIDFEEVRFEASIQCKEPIHSAKASKAKACCGPSLHQIIAAMPNLEAIFTFGEAPLQEVSGYRQWESDARAAALAAKAAERTLARAIKAEAGGGRKYKGPSVADARTALSACQTSAQVPQRGWRGISEQRGSARRISVGSQYAGRTESPGMGDPSGGEIGNFTREVWLFPSLHPKDTSPFKQPRLAPLLGIDFLKFCRLWRGELTVHPIEYCTIRTAGELAAYLVSVNGRRTSVPLGAVPVALDIEFSRSQRELVCIGIGPDSSGKYAIIPFAERDGWRMPGPTRREVMATLQQAFDDPNLSWGGHFACGYDERKLQEQGLTLRCRWDTLYGFHLSFADFGSPKDEQAEESGSREFNQASGYGLGFVSSMLTPHPYHKGVVTHDIDALSVDTDSLHTYCAGDVLRTYDSWVALEQEFLSEWDDPQKGLELLQLEMECTRRAQTMSMRGVPINEVRRKEWLTQVSQQAEALRLFAVQISGLTDFNPASGDQLAKALEAGGIRVKRNTKTGKPVLDGNAIEVLKQKHPDNQLLDVVMQLRALAKDQTALEGLEPDPRGRIHPSIKVHGSVSRWSTSGPTIQNLTEEQKCLLG